MPTMIGTNAPTKAYKGTSVVDKIYLGTNLVFPNAAAGPPLAANLAAWYDASDATSFTLTGALVEQWRDKSGKNNTINTPDSASRPSRSGTQNGKSTVQFGLGHQLKSLATTVIAPSVSTTGITFFWVFMKSGSPQSFESLPLVLAEGSIGRPMEGWNVNRNMTTGSIGSGTGTLWNMALNTPWRIMSNIIKIGTLFEEATNGTVNYTGGTGACTANTTNQSISMARRADQGTQFVGEIAECLIYDRQLTTPERQQVEAYLKPKWGTP